MGCLGPVGAIDVAWARGSAPKASREEGGGGDRLPERLCVSITDEAVEW